MSTAVLSFVSGKFDTTFGGLTVALTRDITDQAPHATCELNATNVARNLLINPEIAPFDNPELRRALALSLDRKAFVDILTEGKGNLGGVMLPPPDGVWGLPPDRLVRLPGYSADATKNREEARAIMKKLGYGPDKRLPIKVVTRDIPPFRDPAVILLDHLKEIYVDAISNRSTRPNGFPVNRKD